MAFTVHSLDITFTFSRWRHRIQCDNDTVCYLTACFCAANAHQSALWQLAQYGRGRGLSVFNWFTGFILNIFLIQLCVFNKRIQLVVIRYCYLNSCYTSCNQNNKKPQRLCGVSVLFFLVFQLHAVYHWRAAQALSIQRTYTGVRTFRTEVRHPSSLLLSPSLGPQPPLGRGQSPSWQTIWCISEPKKSGSGGNSFWRILYGIHVV